MRSRGPAAVAVGTALAFVLLRFTIADADPESNWAKQISPAHPPVLTATSMQEVGMAAAAGVNPPKATLEKIKQLARESPLSAEPFLVAGALAEKRGALEPAGQLYQEAVRRDPRSLAAHYLLADLDLRTGQTEGGIRELAELSRLAPATSVQLVPAVAKFSHSPGAADQVRRMFRSNPALEEPVLSVLAQDPANAEFILSVATRTPERSGPSPAWREILLDGMIAKGQYTQAFAIWSRLTGSSSTNGTGLFNPAFRPSNDPPPFNWSFSATDAGVAEPENGSLRVLFYGRDNTSLAKQIMLLPAGRYRLAMPVTANSGDPHAIGWSIECLPAKTGILQLPLSRIRGSEMVAAEFEVPAQGCEAQQIELDGVSEESPATVDLQIGPLTLQRMGV